MDLTTNYFELFGIPVSYSVDKGRLAESYRELQQLFHPDRFASSSAQERRLSLQMASRINEGNRVLRDPIERARYLLELNEVDLGTDGETLRDNQFLLEQMELREELDEIQHGSDPGSALDRFVMQMDERIREQGEQFTRQWESSHEEARQTIQRMQFFSRLYHQAETMLDDLI
ncbi:MAG: Fe-S protein assembly co-chaperone HscB [Gammaproteobacteria bacterium]|nr:Fe-S protein assembly co-chaperone HscB [Gammaproteobacteria bacterium]